MAVRNSNIEAASQTHISWNQIAVIPTNCYMTVSVLTCVIVEEVSKQTSWDCLMTYNKNVLLSLKLHNDGLQTTDNVHVRLDTTVQHIAYVH